MLPQGYADSGDQFNVIADPLVKDIPRTLKSIDDILYQAESIQGEYDALSLLLRRVIKLKMCVSLNKFVIPTFLKYGGFMLEATPQAEVKILSDLTRIDDFLDSPPQTSKFELQSFLELLNTLHIWSPHIAAKTTVLKGLTRKNVVFLWKLDSHSLRR